jgi:hypothetical protein
MGVFFSYDSGHVGLRIARRAVSNPSAHRSDLKPRLAFKVPHG